MPHSGNSQVQMVQLKLQLRTLLQGAGRLRTSNEEAMLVSEVKGYLDALDRGEIPDRETLDQKMIELRSLVQRTLRQNIARAVGGETDTDADLPSSPVVLALVGDSGLFRRPSESSTDQLIAVTVAGTDENGEEGVQLRSNPNRGARPVGIHGSSSEHDSLLPQAASNGIGVENKQSSNRRLLYLLLLVVIVIGIVILIYKLMPRTASRQEEDCDKFSIAYNTGLKCLSSMVNCTGSQLKSLCGEARGLDGTHFWNTSSVLMDCPDRFSPLNYTHSCLEKPKKYHTPEVIWNNMQFCLKAMYGVLFPENCP